MGRRLNKTEKLREVVGTSRAASRHISTTLTLGLGRPTNECSRIGIAVSESKAAPFSTTLCLVSRPISAVALEFQPMRAKQHCTLTLGLGKPTNQSSRIGIAANESKSALYPQNRGLGKRTNQSSPFGIPANKSKAALYPQHPAMLVDQSEQSHWNSSQ